MSNCCMDFTRPILANMTGTPALNSCPKDLEPSGLPPAAY